MPFKLTNAQLRLFQRTPDEQQMVRYVKLWRMENLNLSLKRKYYNAALHYFIQLPMSVKIKIEELERMNKHKRKHM